MKLNYSCIASMLMVAFCIGFAGSDQSIPSIKTEPKVSTPAIPIQEQEVTGHYSITGKTSEDKIYNGVVTVTHPLGSQIYVVRQLAGTEVAMGVARIVDRKLFIAWKQGELIGLTTVNFDGQRNGSAGWVALPGSGQIRQESWKFLGELEDN